MKATRRHETSAELALTAALRQIGLRFETNSRPVERVPRRADIVFRVARVAVFVDGCFWHGCPEHGTWPRANSVFWRDKIKANIRRDADTNRQLTEANWTALRFWEHESPDDAALAIASVLSRCRVTYAQGTRSRSPNQSRKARALQ
jgi:DNA mismatch endonuclease (patch repair protein)